MFKTVNAYYEPIDIFNKIGERKSELSDEELGFICGLIKERHPRKIVEIGVSAGGTSCVILNCLEKLKIDSEFYSVDLSFTYHYDTSKKCGYQIEEAKKYLKSAEKHKLILGRNIAEVIDKEIGHDIDMLILDTVHYLPGELLDFLVCLPYLTSDALVILDDLTFAHFGENTNAVATKVLYDLVVADKVFLEDNMFYPKLGGVILNKDTRTYVEDYFLGLAMPWWYELSYNDLEVYRNIIRNQYGKREVLLFDEAVKINRDTLVKQCLIKEEIKKLFRICQIEKPILIYGVGQRGVALRIFLEKQVGRKINGFIISDDRKKEEFRNVKQHIFHLGEIANGKEDYQILVAVADPDVRINLKMYNFKYIDIPNFIFPFIKEYVKLLC